MTEAKLKAGDTVRIRSGPFASFPATVDRVSEEGLLLTASVEVFGRATPLELMSCDVEKIEPPEPNNFYRNN
ncbi:MAG TPA: KOW motif-containing protein [Pyrinomonadaceae bacterium]|nr:KOW motif-containing protein [Pyrinomonadaceae bacterium]